MSSTTAILIFFAANVGPAYGQFFRQPGAVHDYTGSFMSISSWVSGSDGQIHHDLRQVRNEETNDGVMTTHTHSEVACTDGLCKQQKLRGMYPSKMLPCMRNIFQSMLARTQSDNTVTPSLRGIVHRVEERKPVFVGVIMNPAVHQIAAPAPTKYHVSNAGMFLLTGVWALFVLFIFISKLYAFSSSHDRPLPTLGEPLVTAQDAETSLAPAAKMQVNGLNFEAKDGESAHARTVAQTLLCHVYLRAAESSATKSYMLRVYAHSTM